MQRHFTKEGLENLKKELQHLKSQRKDVTERLREAAKHGDLSENFDYQEAREEQARLEARIWELEDSIRNAAISVGKSHADTAGIGSIVTIKSGGVKKEYMLVGASEASPLEQKISVESPLGKALFGRKKGDTVTLTLGSEIKEYTIVDIR